MLKHANRRGATIAQAVTPQMRRSECLRAALECLKKGHRIAAETLFARAAAENKAAWQEVL